jgi:hypothetical protein
MITRDNHSKAHDSQNLISNTNLDGEAETDIVNSEIACLKSRWKTLIPL